MHYAFKQKSPVNWVLGALGGDKQTHTKKDRYCDLLTESALGHFNIFKWLDTHDDSNFSVKVQLVACRF